MPSVQLSLLGPPQVRRGDRAVELRAVKGIALAAYLAVTGLPQRREYLADLLWPDSSPEAARKNLRNTLWTVRQALGQEVLVHPEPDRIALAKSVWVDVSILEAAAESKQAADIQAAVEIYRGPFLDGLSLGDAADFEIWLATQRERFSQVYLRLLDSLVAGHRVDADWRKVIEVAHLALTVDDLQEPMYRALMEAHSLLGERAEAIRQYDRLRTTLHRELGVSPLPETEALRLAILTGGPPDGVVQDLGAHPRRRRKGGAQESPLVGRRQELAILDQERLRAAGGQASVVLLTGELGIGKTRLWQAWSRALPASSTVLETHCISTTQSLPYAPLIRLLTHSLCLESMTRTDSAVPSIWLAELARLVPEIREQQPGIPVPAVLPPDEERRRLFEAFTQVLASLEGDPLILFLDDLHWTDSATLDWLVYLVDRMAETPLLLVSAYRPHDAPPQLASLVAGWKRERMARELSLPPFTFQEVRQWVEATGNDSSMSEDLYTASAGNPYFVQELVRSPGGGTPPVLAELIGARINRLPGTARQVLQAAAIQTADPNLVMLRRTSGRGEEEILDALDTLLAAGLLIEGEGRYRFAQPLVATVVQEDLSDARHGFLHRRAAEALEQIHAGDLVAAAGNLAHHYSQAGLPGKAAAYADLAAERALELAALDEAVTFGRLAWTLEPTHARHFRLGRILVLRGDLDSGRRALEAARDGFEAGGDSVAAARACLDLAESHLPSGQSDLVLRWATEALGYLKRQPGPEALAHAYYLLGAGSAQAGRSLAQAETYLQQAARLAAENNLPGMAARSEFERGNVLAQRGNLTGAIHSFEQSIALARAAQVWLMEVLGHNNLAYHAQLAGDLVTARRHIQAGLALAEEHSLFLPRQYLYSTQGEIALAEDDLDTAISWFHKALAEAQKYNNRLQAANIRANLGLVARRRGDLDQALAHLERACTMAGDTAGLHLHSQIDLWLAELHLQRGEADRARAALARAEAYLSTSEHQGLIAYAAGIRAALPSPEEQP